MIIKEIIGNSDQQLRKASYQIFLVFVQFCMIFYFFEMVFPGLKPSEDYLFETSLIL